MNLFKYSRMCEVVLGETGSGKVLTHGRQTAVAAILGAA